MLLTFATQTAASAAKALKNAVKDAHSEEALKPKILNYRPYVDLIQMIINNICLIEDQGTVIKADDEVNEIKNSPVQAEVV